MFDAEGARRAGYSDAEIRGVQGALAAGYSPAEISAHLSQRQQPKKPGYFDDLVPEPGAKPPAAKKGYFDDLVPEGYQLDQTAANSPPAGFILDQPSVVSDVAKSAGAGVLRGIIRGAGAPGDVASAVLPQGPSFNERFAGEPTGAYGTIVSALEKARSALELPTSAGIQKAVEGVTGPLYSAQTKPGEYTGSVGEMIGNPFSWVGPGGAAVKAGAAVLSGLAGQAGEDVAGGPGRLIGSVLGGVTGAKTLGPRAVEAAIPTQAELAAAKDAGYAGARASEVILDPQRVATNFAAPVEQHLTAGPKYAFTGGADGTAPRTLGLLNKLQNPPGGAAGITAANLATIRRQLGDIAGETKDFKPTSDAKAAMVAKRLFDSYLENGAVGDAVAGDAKAFAANTAEANANNAAMEKVRTFNQKIANAEEKSAGTSGPSLSNTLGTEARQFLRNPKAQRGYTPEEIAAVRGVNRGTLTSNTLNQLGRGGAGVVPMVAHLAAAVPAAAATGGASLIPQAALAAGLYGARKVGERMTAKQAQAIIDTLAKRSPLYEQRVNALPPAQPSAVRGAVLRAVAGGM